MGAVDRDARVFQGSDHDNQALSQRRAESVRAYLLERPELEGATAAARGAGEAEPSASNQTPEGRAGNRRVEIIAASGN